MNDTFRRLSHGVSGAMGSPWAFVGAVTVIGVWAVTGPVFHYSDTWQLIINTGTTIVTFLMVFLIQNTQNRDSTALHLKLDELLRAVAEARTSMVDLEDLNDEQLAALQGEFQRLREHKEREETRFSAPGADRRVHAAAPDTDAPARRLEDRLAASPVPDARADTGHEADGTIQGRRSGSGR